MQSGNYRARKWRRHRRCLDLGISGLGPTNKRKRHAGHSSALSSTRWLITVGQNVWKVFVLRKERQHSRVRFQHSYYLHLYPSYTFAKASNASSHFLFLFGFVRVCGRHLDDLDIAILCQFSFICAKVSHKNKFDPKQYWLCPFEVRIMITWCRDAWFLPYFTLGLGGNCFKING